MGQGLIILSSPFFRLLDFILSLLAKAERQRVQTGKLILAQVTEILIEIFDPSSESEAVVTSEQDEEAAVEATFRSVGSASVLILLVWGLGWITNYRIDSIVYGIAVAAAGSMLLGGTDFAEVSASKGPEDDFQARKLIRRGVGFYLITFGFAIQIGVMYVSEVQGISASVPPIFLNSVFVVLLLIFLFATQNLYLILMVFSPILLITVAVISHFGIYAGRSILGLIIILSMLGLLSMVGLWIKNQVVWILRLLREPTNIDV